MRFFQVLGLSVLVSFSSYGQINATYWGVEDTTLSISKTTDFGIVHDYLELYNYAGQDLDMRWIAYFGDFWPSLWIASFNDPGNWSQNISHLDSADFTLTDPVGFQNKLIIGVNHQSQAGTGTISFKVFPVDHPDDFLTLHYRTSIAQGNAFASIENSVDHQILINNIGDKMISISNVKKPTTVKIYSLTGALIHSANVQESTSNLQLSHLESGFYMVECRQADGTSVSKKIVI